MLGRISIRDDKDPQLVAENVLPLDAALRPFNAPRPRRDDYGAYARAASSVKERHGVPQPQPPQRGYGQAPQARTEERPAPQTARPKYLYVQLPSLSHPAAKRIEELLIMFPPDGSGQKLVLCPKDSRQRIAADCLIHPALADELRLMLGDGNVVVK